jgi:hypothetical protein
MRKTGLIYRSKGAELEGKEEKGNIRFWRKRTTVEIELDTEMNKKMSSSLVEGVVKKARAV